MWSAKQYLAFEDERTRPVRDLLSAIPAPTVETAVDLGCGPGNSTEAIIARFPAAKVSGMDSSPEMLVAARKRLPDIAFEEADLSTWSPPAPVDLLFSNAVLQWVPDHATLLPRLMTHLKPGGNLAIQMPVNLGEPAHVLIREVAADGPWAAKLANAAAARAARQPPEWYYAALKKEARRVDMWLTTYFHVLQGGAQAIVDWFRSTGLRPFIQPLEPAEAEAFLEAYRQRLVPAYPEQPDGSVLLPFPRLFMVATR